jgi:hypothetical protein
VTVEKLTGTKIHQGRCAYLPQKDYQSDPAAKKEIEDRDQLFTELEKRHPGQFLHVKGVETPEDMQSLVETSLEFFEANQQSDDQATQKEE